jgi:hypothetical protein
LGREGRFGGPSEGPSTVDMFMMAYRRCPLDVEFSVNDRVWGTGAFGRTSRGVWYRLTWVKVGHEDTD